LAADENGSIKIWDINKGTCRSEYITPSSDEEEGNAIRSIAVSENEGFLVAARSNGFCSVFDYSYSEDLKPLSSFEAHKNYITKCVLSPEHKYINNDLVC
jgi:G protein beta subunit-like protein